MKWKRYLSAMLVCVMAGVTFIPASAQSGDVPIWIQQDGSILGDNGTWYDANYDPYIGSDDEYCYDEDDDYEIATASNYASDSNWRLATAANWTLATDSDAAAYNITEFTDAAPLRESSRNLLRRSRALRAEEANKGIHTSKTVTGNKNGTYTITLESYVEGTVEESEKPVDIVLVLDTSTSMRDYCMVCGAKMSEEGGTCEGENQYNSYSFSDDLNKTKGEKLFKWQSRYRFGNEDTIKTFEAEYCTGKCGMQHTAGWCFGDPHTNIEEYIRKYGQYYTENKLLGIVSHHKMDRMTALKKQVDDFIDGIAATADETTDRQIGIVEFASGAKVVTGLTSVSNQNGVDGLKGAVDQLEAHNRPVGGTMSNLGLAAAVEMLENSHNQKVVIMFTDGVPGTGGNEGDSKFNDKANTVANAAIDVSFSLKTDSNTTVYTIGVFGNANGTPPTDEKPNSISGDANKYMHYVSSNFPDAESMTKPGEMATLKGKSYYLTADGDDGLADAFKSILQQIQTLTPFAQLDGSTQLTDVITPYFEVKTGTDSVKVFTQNSTGKKNSNGEYEFSGNLVDITKDIKIETKTNQDSASGGTTSGITVTGFDYASNFVAKNGRREHAGDLNTDFHGKKLIVRITVEPRDEFLGGNNVPTNVETESGIFNNEQKVNLNFAEKPTVNVPLSKLTVAARNVNVYLLENLSEDDLAESLTVTAKRGENSKPVTIDLSKGQSGNYGLDSWQTEFVDIENPVYENLKEANLAELIDDQTNIKATVTMKPSQNPAEDQTKTASADMNIRVFKPVLTYKDGDAYYGAPVPDQEVLERLRTKTEWIWEGKDNKKISSTDEGIVMHSEPAPTLTTVIEPANRDKVAGEKTNETINTKVYLPMNVTKVGINGNYQTLGGEQVVELTTILNKNCEDGKDKDKSSWRDTDPEHFYLHIATCSLRITKQGGAKGEPYVFKIQKKDESGEFKPYTYASVTGNTSVTIKELPVGEYKVVEDGNWSWRYTANDNEVKLEASEGKADQNVTCVNTKNKNFWLNGFSAVVQNIFGKGKAVR